MTNHTKKNADEPLTTPASKPTKRNIRSEFMMTACAAMAGAGIGNIIGRCRSEIPQYAQTVAVAAAERVASNPDNKDLTPQQIMERVEKAEKDIAKERAQEIKQADKSEHDRTVGAITGPIAAWMILLGTVLVIKRQQKKDTGYLDLIADQDKSTPYRRG